MPSRKRSSVAVAQESPVREGRRRSGRLQATPSKSVYFEGSDGSEDELASKAKSKEAPKKRGRPVKRQKVAEQDDSSDGYQDQGETENDDDQDDDAEYDDAKPHANGSANLKYEDDDDDDDEDAPPKVTVIPLEKLRGDGGVDYADSKVHNNTMLFLKDLKANNRRPWLKSHDGEYRRAIKDWNSFVETSTLSIMEVDDTIPELPTKDVIFRIHRDIRFSKDPTPYKPHFSAAWSRTGRKGPYACYYVHCEPRSSFLGGGLWCPEKQSIDKLRRHIDRHPARWRTVLNEAHFKRTFLPTVKASAGPEKAVQAFLDRNKSGALKIRPMGYDATHPDIGLLKLRNFTVSAKLGDDFFLQDDVQDKLTDLAQALHGYVTFINSIVMPDNDDGDDSSGDEEQDEQNDNEDSDTGNEDDD